MKTLLAVLSVCILVCVPDAVFAVNCASPKDKSYCMKAFCIYPNIKKECPVICEACPATPSPECVSPKDKSYCSAAICIYPAAVKDCPVICKACPGAPTTTVPTTTAPTTTAPTTTAPTTAATTTETTTTEATTTAASTTAASTASTTAATTTAASTTAAPSGPNAAVSKCSIIRNGVSVYRGTQSTSNNGTICQKWTSQSPNRHSYSDIYFKNTEGTFPETIKEADNYCRDPSRRRPSGRLWCYNGKGTRPRWDWCDEVVPKC